MEVKQRSNVKHWTPRAKHHAKRLERFARIMTDFFGGGVSAIKVLKTRIQVSTRNGVYLVRPLTKRGKGYVGIEIKKYRATDDKAVRLIVEEVL